ncbi:MAG: TetR/AcrR family transcriptional regulator [Acutalibacteraceae bacterium]
MDKSESKYFNTAARMDKAFLELLEKKDFAYITVKEICQKAGVNRSTFYLHYETLDDLLTESVQYLYTQFSDYMKPSNDGIVLRLRDCPADELYLVTPAYLTPYLGYIKEHKRLFCTALEHYALLRLEETYERMFRHIFAPILERFQVPERDRPYIMTFHLQGLMAIITEWLKNDCTDSVSHVISVIQQCVTRPQTKEEP